jgi:3-oxoacyl-[acyl-carrier-protein] synthase-1
MSDFCYIDEIKNEYRDAEGVKNISQAQIVDNNFLTAVYRTLGFNYPKFFKMDDLSKAGFLVMEMLVSVLPSELDKKNTAVVFFNREASPHTDRHFEETIKDADNFFPSPSVFVYTLPNIVSGEVCIRHGFQGESGFYVLENYDEKAITDICNDMLATNGAVICGYVDFTKGYAYARAEYFTKELNLGENG